MLTPRSVLPPEALRCHYTHNKWQFSRFLPHFCVFSLSRLPLTEPVPRFVPEMPHQAAGCPHAPPHHVPRASGAAWAALSRQNTDPLRSWHHPQRVAHSSTTPRGSRSHGELEGCSGKTTKTKSGRCFKVFFKLQAVTHFT